MSKLLSAGGNILVGVPDRGRAALFDGAKASLMHHTPPAAYQPILDNGTITVEVWVFPTRIGPGYGVRQDIWRVRSPTYSLYYWLAEYANWAPQFYWQNEFGDNYVVGPPLQAQRWTHLAVTYNRAGGPGNLKLYVNGGLYTTATAQGNLPFVTLAGNGQVDPGGRCDIGFFEEDGSRHFGGQMDEFRLWNVERSAPQIATGMMQSIYYNNLTDRTGLAFALGCETIVPTPPGVQANHSPNALEDSSGYGGHAFTNLNSELPARIGSLAPLPYRIIGLQSV